MPTCAVFGCKTQKNKLSENPTKFYKFPKNPDLASKWIEACGRDDQINLKNAVICSQHFDSKCFIESMKYRLLNITPPRGFRNLQPDAVPTLFLPDFKYSIHKSHPRRKHIQRPEAIFLTEHPNSDGLIVDTVNHGVSPSKRRSYIYCQHCKYRTMYESMFKHHNDKHLDDSVVRWYRCEHCEFKSKWQTTLSNHLNIKHGVSKEVKWFSCDQCVFTTRQKAGLIQHQNDCHSPML